MRRTAGFTLIELLVVMVVIGILATIAVSRFSSRSPFDELGYTQEVAAAARYAQKLALATRCPVRFQMSDASGFRLARPDGFSAGTCSPNFAATVANPANPGTAYEGRTPTSLTVTASGGFPATRVFDAQGGITPDSDLSIQVGTRFVIVRHGGGQVVVQ